MNPAETKQRLRRELGERWALAWPESGAPDRPPRFPEAGRAAARMARLPEFRKARTLAVLPDPVLLQARVDGLRVGKNLVAATPGLKKGLVRLVPGQVPIPQLSRDLRGGSLEKVGSVLRFPEARLNRVDLVVGAALAVDPAGGVLGDGRGVLDLFMTLLGALGALDKAAPLVVLVHDDQVLEEALPLELWDARAQIVVTPERVLRTGAPGGAVADLAHLPPRLASLPVVQGVREATSS